MDLQELSKRRVLRTISGYAVVCFVALQIADVTFEPLSIDQSVLRTLIAIMAVGFPVVAYLAWIFDTGGVVEVRTTTTRRVWVEVALGLITVAIFAVACFYIWFNEEDPGDQSAIINDGTPAIAVLPFENLDDTEDYFAAGVAEEILNRMIRFNQVKVISRHSSFNYGKSDLDIKTIGQLLRADYVLRGSVRRSAELVRISVYLADTRKGEEIWGNSYDRSIGEMLAVQGEIATLAIRELLPSINAPVEVQPEVDPTAYELYLRARAAIAANDPLSAKPLLQSAITLDPAFGQAYAALADVHESLRIYGFPAFVGDEELESTLARALELDPQNLEALAVDAILDLYVRANPKLANSKFSRLVDTSSSTRVLHHYRSLLVAMDKRDEGLRIAERRKALDPDSRITIVTEFWAHYARGEFAKARAVAERLPLEPVSDTGWSGRRPWLVHLDLAEGRFDDAKKRINQLGANFHDEGKRYFELLLAIASGDLAGARSAYASKPLSISAMPYMTWMPFDVVLTEDVNATIEEMERRSESRSIVWISQAIFRERWVRQHGPPAFVRAFDRLREDPRYLDALDRTGLLQ